MKFGGRVLIIKAPSHLEQFKGRQGYVKRIEADGATATIVVDLADSGRRHEIKIPKSCLEALP